MFTQMSGDSQSPDSELKIVDANIHRHTYMYIHEYITYTHIRTYTHILRFVQWNVSEE